MREITIFNKEGEVVEKKENDFGGFAIQKVKTDLAQWLNWIDILYGGMCIILREELPEKVGELYIPDDVRKTSQAGASLGIILKISTKRPFFQGHMDEHAIDRLTNIAPGDICMFDQNRPERIGKGFKTDMKHYPVHLVHVCDLHTKWTGPFMFEDSKELQDIVKVEREKWIANIENIIKGFYK